MASERAAFLQKLSQGVGFMMNRKLAVGLSSWKSRVFDGVSDDPMAKALRYFLNQGLARGWECWQANWEEEKAKRDSMRKSLGHLVNRELSKGWRAWYAMASERAAFLQKLRQGLGFMMNRKLAVGLSSWKARVFGGVSDDPMAKALRYFLNQGLSRGWECWQSNWEEEKAKRDSMRKSLGHLVNRELSKGWRAWYAMASERAAFLQ